MSVTIAFIGFIFGAVIQPVPAVGNPIPSSGYNRSIPDCGLSAAKVFDTAPEGWRRVGTLKRVTSAAVPDESCTSIGFEGLDRKLFDPDRTYDALAASGVKWARVQTMWSVCEKQKGVYDFSELDSIVDNLRTRGLVPWFNVGFGNTNYMENCYSAAAVGNVPLYYGDECRKAWLRYVRALAKHYRGRIACWEIWNESNLESFWRPRDICAKDYVELVRITAAEIKAEIPDAKIGACTSSGGLDDWAREFFREGGARLLDFWCFHPYGLIPEVYRRDQKVSKTDGSYVAEMREARAFVDGLGGKKIEFWNGEAGFPSWFPADHWLYPQGVCKEGWQSEANQAKWLLRRFVTDRAAGFIRSSFYQAADISRHYSKSSDTIKHPAEHGVLNGWTYEPKLSYQALANYSSLLSTAAFLDLEYYKGVLRMDFRFPDSTSFIVYYKPEDISRLYDGAGGMKSWETTDMSIPRFIADPVLVDLLRGGIYEPIGKDAILPVTDYPLAIVSRKRCL